MRKFSLLLLLVIPVLLVTSCGKKSTGLKDTPPKVKLYSVPAVRIEFDYAGGATGTKTLLIANYGMYEREENNFSMSGTENKMLSIRNDSVSYMIDLKTKEGRSTPSEMSQLESMMHMNGKQQYASANEFLINNMGAKKTGKETVAGKECDVYEIDAGMQAKIKVYMWSGIVLKSEGDMGAHKIIWSAKKVDTDVTPTIEDFSVPKDVKIKAPEPATGLPPGHPSIDSAK
jgi:hypothetical protein